MPELSIESVNFRKVWEWVSSGQQEALAEYLSEKVNCLVKGGAGDRSGCIGVHGVDAIAEG